jgi:tRNA 2-selenouridine synthase
LFQPLRAHRGHSTVDGWISLLRAGNHEALARALMTDHYDAAYAKSRAVHPHQILATLTTDRLDTDGQNALADAIMAIVA